MKKSIPIDKAALDNYLKSFHKEFGNESVYRLTDEPQQVEVIPSGILPLDRALGVGGIPRGRIIEIYGPEMSGKTSLALQFAAQAQRLGETIHFIDAEHALDMEYAAKIGLQAGDAVLISQPDHGEQALEMVNMAVDHGIGLIVVDSVAALTPKAELEGEMGAPQMGLQARLMSQAMRKITSSVSNHNSVVIFINQIRMKIGVMFGNPETTTGGNALKFYASVRMEVRSPGKNKENEVIVGQKTKVKVVKNKVAPPFREAEFNLIYGEGFDVEQCIVDLAVDRGIIEKSGAWYNYGGTRLGQGMMNVRQFLKQSPETLTAIRESL